MFEVPKVENVPEVANNFLTATYQLRQAHFHWGPDDYRGSEHEINDRHYPLEV